MIQESLFVGIDASKLRFDGYVHPSGTRLTSGSSAREIAALTRRIAALAPTAVGLEASGGYERRLADSLHAAGLAVYILPPARVRGFARAIGQFAKTDAIDATMIAHYLAATHHRLAPYAPDPVRSRLSALAAHRRRLVAEKSGLTSQCDTIDDPMVRDMIAQRLHMIARHVAALDRPCGNCWPIRPAWDGGTSDCKRWPVWGRSSPQPCSPICPNWAMSRQRWPQPCSAWLLMPASQGYPPDRGAVQAAANICETSPIWVRSAP